MSQRKPGWVEIVEGLQAGDAVVLNPGSLRTGEPVTVTVSGVANAGGSNLVTSVLH